MANKNLDIIPVHRSIKFRLIRGVIVLVLLIVVGFAVFTLRQNDAYFEAGLMNDAKAVIDPFHSQLLDNLPATVVQQEQLIKLSVLTTAPIFFPALVKSHSDLLSVCFVDPSGQRLFSFGSVELTAEKLASIVSQAKPTSETLIDITGQEAVVAVPLVLSQQHAGFSVLVFSTELYDEQHSKLILTSGWVLLIASLVGVIGAYSIGERIASPIVRLAQHIGDPNGAGLSLWEQNDDEVTMLASRFKEMQEEIGKKIEELNQEISVRIRTESYIKRIAFYDELTGLPNRSLFNDRLSEAITNADTKSTRIAVLFIDLDGFKHINDFHGHPVGDRLLRNLGRRLDDRFKETDTIARFGGDEFVAIVDATDRTELKTLVDDIVSLCSKIRNIDDYVFALSASIGICFYPQHGSSATELLKNADIAMYQAKLNGGNEAVVFDQSMAIAVNENVQIRDDLIKGIENQEFELHYQPIFDLKTRAMVAVEALIRWHHPKRGLVLPDTFIRIAEENGLITDIGNWALAEACRQFERWRKTTDSLQRMCINVSPTQIEDEQFFATVTETIQSTGIAPDCIEFELTENVLISVSKESDSKLIRLRELGVKIAIDDFGTGYSSLSYLRQFPINTLKIDRSFVDGCANDDSRIGILRAIVTMTEMLGIKSIAEGIDTEADLTVVLNEGCVEGQGYLLSEPLSAEAFGNYIASRAVPA